MQVPVRTLVINQVVDQGATDKFLAMRRKDQQRALELLRSLPALRCASLLSALSACCTRLVPCDPRLTYIAACLHILSCVLPVSCPYLPSVAPRLQQRCILTVPLVVCRDLQVTEAKLADLEIVGVPALKYFGDQVWQ